MYSETGGSGAHAQLGRAHVLCTLFTWPTSHVSYSMLLALRPSGGTLTVSPIPSSPVNEAPENLPARYFHDFVTLSAFIRIQSAGNRVRWSVGACPDSS